MGGGRGCREREVKEVVVRVEHKVRRPRLSVFVFLSPPWFWGPSMHAPDPKASESSREVS